MNSQLMLTSCPSLRIIIIKIFFIIKIFRVDFNFWAGLLFRVLFSDYIIDKRNLIIVLERHHESKLDLMRESSKSDWMRQTDSNCWKKSIVPPFLIWTSSNPVTAMTQISNWFPILSSPSLSMKSQPKPYVIEHKQSIDSACYKIFGTLDPWKSR